MKITIPNELTPLAAINFANYIEKINPSDKEYIYDFGNMQHCRPFGLLVVATAIRRNITRFPDAQHIPIHTDATQGCQFAASFGFFQSIGFDIGEVKEEWAHGERYIPIKCLSVQELNAVLAKTTILNEKIDYQSCIFADLLAEDKSRPIKDSLQYCFREIMRNTFEHGETDHLWVCGQFWPSRSEAEIVILDEGIGILKSLKSNSRINVTSCQEALSLAIQPGLSRTLGKPLIENDVWQNSGYGLYVASTLAALCNGYFILHSGDKAIIINSDGQNIYESAHAGTVVGISIHTDSKPLRNFAQTLTNIITEGEAQAKLNADKRILTASKISSIASMIQHIRTANEMIDQVNNTSNSPSSNQLVPKKTQVEFQVCSHSPRGEISGWFEYNGIKHSGKLVNVNAKNREFYCATKRKMRAIVGKYNGKEYILSEPKYSS